MRELSKVMEFNNEIIGLEVVDKLNTERLEWFKTVVNEELNEFILAHKNNDRVGMLDALIDELYFILGRVQELGYTEKQFELAFNAVHNCNMNKKKGNKGRGSDTDAIKESTWKGPEEMIQQILKDENNFTSESEIFENMSPVFAEVTHISMKKSQDYNNGQYKPMSRSNYFPFGLLSYAQMLHTKSQRLNSLAQQTKKPNNESIRDTLLDMINYATFAIEAIDKGEV